MSTAGFWNCPRALPTLGTNMPLKTVKNSEKLLVFFVKYQERLHVNKPSGQGGTPRTVVPKASVRMVLQIYFPWKKLPGVCQTQKVRRKALKTLKVGVRALAPLCFPHPAPMSMPKWRTEGSGSWIAEKETTWRRFPQRRQKIPSTHAFAASFEQSFLCCCVAEVEPSTFFWHLWKSPFGFRPKEVTNVCSFLYHLPRFDLPMCDTILEDQI